MKVKELLTDESKWTKEWFARDKNGNGVDELSPEASCWCLLGAIYQCYGMSSGQDIVKKVKKEVKNLISWNDNPDRTFEDVKTLVEKLDI